MSLKRVKKLKNPNFPQCDHCRRLESNYKTVEPVRYHLPAPLDDKRSKVLFPQVEICHECITHPAYDLDYWKKWFKKIETGKVVTKAYDVYCEIVTKPRKDDPSYRNVKIKKITAVAESESRAGTAASYIARKTLDAHVVLVKRIDRSASL